VRSAEAFTAAPQIFGAKERGSRIFRRSPHPIEGWSRSRCDFNGFLRSNSLASAQRIASVIPAAVVALIMFPKKGIHPNENLRSGESCS